MADHTQTTPSAATDAQTDTQTDAQDVPASAQTKEAPVAHRIDNILNRPLAELSIAGLVERFAHALETHRASVAEQTKTAPAPQHSAPTPDSAHATHRSTAHHESAPAAPPPPYVPSALRPIAIDGDDEGYGDENGEIVSDIDLTSALARPTYSAGHTANRSASDQAAEPVPFAIARDTFVEPTGGADSYYEDCERDDEYSSLLTMKSPFNLPRETVRVYDEDDSEDSGSGSTVVFPGQNDRRGRPAGDDMAYPADGADAVPPHSEIAPATAARRRDVAETEQRLREALEKLQRMSGAA